MVRVHIESLHTVKKLFKAPFHIVPERVSLQKEHTVGLEIPDKILKSAAYVGIHFLEPVKLKAVKQVVVVILVDKSQLCTEINLHTELFACFVCLEKIVTVNF